MESKAYQDIIEDLLILINDNIDRYISAADRLVDLSNDAISNDSVSNDKIDKYLYAAEIITEITDLVNNTTKDKLLKIFNLDEDLVW